MSSEVKDDLTMDVLLETMNKFMPKAGFIPEYKLIESRFMTDWYEFIKIKRTWKERLFTRPWMPQIKHTYKPGPQVPAMHVFIMGDKIIGHPKIISAIAGRNRRHDGAKGGRDGE